MSCSGDRVSRALKSLFEILGEVNILLKAKKNRHFTVEEDRELDAGINLLEAIVRYYTLELEGELKEVVSSVPTCNTNQAKRQRFSNYDN